MYLLNVLIGVDQLLNTICGGKPDETLSAACYRLKDRQPHKAFRFIIDLLFFWQKGHCKISYDAEQQRLQLPKSYKSK